METNNVCTVKCKTCMAVKYNVKMHLPLKTSGNTTNIVVSMQKPCFCISYLTVETEEMIWLLRKQGRRRAVCVESGQGECLRQNFLSPDHGFCGYGRSFWSSLI